MRFFFLLVSTLLFSKIIFSTENNGLIFEISNTARVNSTFISSTEIGVGSSDNILEVYNVEGSHLWSFTTDNSIFDTQITSDGKIIVVASEDRNLYMLDKFGRKLWKFRAPRSLKKVAISEDGLMVAVVSDDLNLYVLDKDGDIIWKKNK